MERLEAGSARAVRTCDAVLSALARYARRDQAIDGLERAIRADRAQALGRAGGDPGAVSDAKPLPPPSPGPPPVR